MAGLFLPGKESVEYESGLLRKFLRELEDIGDYLDEYDEFMGLAFNEYEPTECLEKLSIFLRERHSELIDYLEKKGDSR